MKTVRLSAMAEDDLLNAWLYVADESVSAADRLLWRIKEEADTLLLQPRMGRSRDELAPGLRSWPTRTPYIMFYFIDEEGIVIVRVLHHARDIQSFASWSEE